MAETEDAIPAIAARREKLQGRSLEAANVTLKAAGPAARLSLRAPDASIAALSRALGVRLPQAPKSSAASKDGGRMALWLGPDEWLVIGPEGTGLLADAGKADALHSAVDVSHRNVAILVEGAGAQTCLCAGCPLDLADSAFAVGAATRTVLGKAEIVLMRSGERSFRVEVWRSFADYVCDLLADTAWDRAAQ